MKLAPKLISIKAGPKFNLYIQFENGVSGHFNFCDYYDFEFPFDFLSDARKFSQIKISPDNRQVFWLDNKNKEIELDSEVLYAIISGQKIYYKDQIVFDPSLGKAAWLR